MATDAPDILTKAAFAAKHGRDGSAVSKWIARGHLTDAALTPDGRINVVEAERQLGERLDQSRSIGKLFARTAEPSAPSPPPPSELGAMAAIKLEQAQRALRRDREGDLERRGLYIRVSDIRREHARELAAFIGTVEQRLPELVQLLGGGKAETVTARRWWRSLRQAESDTARGRAAAEPEFVQERELVDAA